MSLISLHSYAQRYELGFNGAGTGYLGDINSTNPLYIKSFGGGVFVKYNIDPTWGFKAAINHLHLKGDDQDFDNDFQQLRNLKFQNQLSELAMTVEFNFLSAYNNRRTSTFTPYIFAGIAGLRHDPYIYYGDEKIRLRPLLLEFEKEEEEQKLYAKYSVAIPIGFGFKYKLNSSWSVGAELNYRLAFTDYLDNVSKSYANAIPTNLDLPNISIKDGNETRKFDLEDWAYLVDPSSNFDSNLGVARGDGRKKDGYMTAGITLTYTIFSRNCFSWVK